MKFYISAVVTISVFYTPIFMCSDHSSRSNYSAWRQPTQQLPPEDLALLGRTILVLTTEREQLQQRLSETTSAVTVLGNQAKALEGSIKQLENQCTCLDTLRDKNTTLTEERDAALAKVAELERANEALTHESKQQNLALDTIKQERDDALKKASVQQKRCTALLEERQATFNQNVAALCQQWSDKQLAKLGSASVSQQENKTQPSTSKHRKRNRRKAQGHRS